MVWRFMETKNLQTHHNKLIYRSFLVVLIVIGIKRRMDKRYRIEHVYCGWNSLLCFVFVDIWIHANLCFTQGIENNS